MGLDRRARALLQLNQVVFLVLFVSAIGLLAWLTNRYHIEADWTANGSNSLTDTSRRLLERIEGPVIVTAYARPDLVLRRATEEMIERYRRVKPDVSLKFVNPDRVPDLVRELGIAKDGELVVEYRGQVQHVLDIKEQAITNAIIQAARRGGRWVVFVTGHGERDLLGSANHDLGRFGAQLERRGYRVQGINLAASGGIPDNTAVLVVSQPSVALLPGEVEGVIEYLQLGGNLLWLADPSATNRLDALATWLGVSLGRGTIVEPRTRLYEIDDPAMALVTTYPAHAATRGFDLVTVFPRAAGIAVEPRDGWSVSSLLVSGSETWSEAGALEDEVAFDAGRDIAGPLDIGVALERERARQGTDHSSATQRIVVVGDGDFLSNAFVGNGGNLDLGMGLIHWLTGDDDLVDIPVRTAPDLRLELTRFAAGAIALGSLFGIPALLAVLGTTIWLRRRHR